MTTTTLRKHVLGLTAILLASWPLAAWAQVEVAAVSGEPFGVARVTVVTTEPAEALRVSEEAGRVLYPAVDSRPVRQRLRNLLGINRPRSVNLYFLFRGREPLDLVVSGAEVEKVRAIPVRERGTHEQLLAAWWQGFRAPTRIWNQLDDYPPQVENYLATMLARRLDLPIGERRLGLIEADSLASILGPLVGTEDARIKIERDTMLGTIDPVEPATLPLPRYAPPEVVLAEPDEEVVVEPIAMHVPVECFYLRFGSFSNFRWLTSTMERAGGDLGGIFSARGLRHDLRGRIEDQLATHQTELSKVLGDVVIDDVAIIGADASFRQGASFGILFEAGDPDALAANFQQQHRESLAKHPDATETEVDIAGHKVAFLSTPDNRVRSYLAVDGKYYFVTTSATLARRFFEAGEGDRALGQAVDFRHARRVLTVERRDTVFAYLSDAFLREIASPSYRIEMGRRLQAVADLELLELARLAAKAEGRPAESIDELVAAGLLPERFGTRPDGSQTRLENGVAFDTLRGQRGSFVPAADIRVKAASQAEIDEYEKFAAQAEEKWERVEPAAIAIKRRLRDGGRERVTIDAIVTPAVAQGNNRLTGLLGQLVGRGLGFFGGAQGGVTSSAGLRLGPPDSRRLAPLPGDLVAADVVLGDQHVFAGLRDIDITQSSSPLASIVPPGLLDSPLASFLTQSPQDYLVGYLGATRGPGALSFLERRGFEPPDADGYSRSARPLTRRQFGDMVLYSYHPAILEDAAPRLVFEDADRPAQAWVHVADITGTQLARKIDILTYGRARRTSQGNAAFLDALSQQLHVPPEECLGVAGRILGARLVCPLEGDYVLSNEAGNGPRWVSTAWSAGDQRGEIAVPDDYRSRPLRWFRGLEADLTLLDGVLSFHGVVETQLPENAEGPQPELVPLPAEENDLDVDLPDVEVTLPPELQEATPTPKGP